MNVTLSLDQFNNALIEAAKMGSRITLQEAGLLKNTITLAEVRKQHGPTLANTARMSAAINWKPYGKGGKTSGVYCSREELEKFILNRKFDFNHK